MTEFRGAPNTAEERANVLSQSGSQTQEILPPGWSKTARPMMKPRNFLLVVGTLLVALVVFIPLNMGLALMSDPSYVFFLGRDIPTKIVQSCVASIFLYMFLIVLFFSCAKEEAKTDQTVHIIVSIVMTILGLSLLMLSVPLKQQTLDVYEEMFTNCYFGPRTQRLYEYSTVLQGLRATSACSLVTSVEMCEGYQESQPYTGFLKQLESTYQCSGFCYGNSTKLAAMAAVAAEPAIVMTTTPDPSAALLSFGHGNVHHVEHDKAVPSARAAAAAPPAASYLASAINRRLEAPGASAELASPGRLRLLQAIQKMSGSPQAPPAALLQIQANKSIASLPSSFQPQEQAAYAGFAHALQPPPGPAAVAQTGLTKPLLFNLTDGLRREAYHGMYPPTLFSQTQYQASCDGMVARDLKFQAVDTANWIYMEGVAMLVLVVWGGLFKICGLCVQVPKQNLATADEVRTVYNQNMLNNQNIA